MRLFLYLPTLLMAAATAAFGCPACPTDLGLTVAEEIASADIALEVEWVAGNPADVDAGLPGQTEYRVVTVLRDSTGAIEEGDPVEVPRHREAEEEDRFLLLGVADGMLRWSSPLPLTTESSDYVRAVPPPNADHLERLRFFARYFEHPDLMIASDAFAEFAAARYEDVVVVADAFDVDELRGWLADEDTHPLRMGLYGLLLGQHGDNEDAEFLKREILRPSEDFRFGLEGMISGYLLLTGEDGLQVIEDSKLRDRDVSFSETYGAMQSLRFMWSYTEGIISKERLRAAMRILMDRTEFADLVITDLARWQDWSIAEQLMELYGTDGYDIPSIKRAIVRYYLVAARATGDDEGDTTPDHVRIAQECLANLRESDPDTVKSAERFFFIN